MEGKRLLRSIQLRSILSYGPESESVELEPLNVLIGPNGSGKSNLIEAISILKAAPGDLSAPIREGGGIAEWVWKGGYGNEPRRPQILAIVLPIIDSLPLLYMLRLDALGYQAQVNAEAVAGEAQKSERDSDQVFYINSTKRPQAKVLVEIESIAGNGNQEQTC